LACFKVLKFYSGSYYVGRTKPKHLLKSIFVEKDEKHLENWEKLYYKIMRQLLTKYGSVVIMCFAT